jgi:hypothetical protein
MTTDKGRGQSHTVHLSRYPTTTKLKQSFALRSESVHTRVGSRASPPAARPGLRGGRSVRGGSEMSTYRPSRSLLRSFFAYLPPRSDGRRSPPASPHPLRARRQLAPEVFAAVSAEAAGKAPQGAGQWAGTELRRDLRGPGASRFPVYLEFRRR